MAKVRPETSVYDGGNLTAFTSDPIGNGLARRTSAISLMYELDGLYPSWTMISATDATFGPLEAIVVTPYWMLIEEGLAELTQWAAVRIQYSLKMDEPQL